MGLALPSVPSMTNATMAAAKVCVIFQKIILYGTQGLHFVTLVT
jgi:hypothetical protein